MKKIRHYFELHAAKAEIVAAVRASVMPSIYSHLGLLSRVQPFKEQLPAYQDWPTQLAQIAEFAKAVLNDESYWQALPDYIPLSYEKVQSVGAATESPMFPYKDEKTKERAKQALEKGLPKTVARQHLQEMLSCYDRGDLSAIINPKRK